MVRGFKMNQTDKLGRKQGPWKISMSRDGYIHNELTFIDGFIHGIYKEYHGDDLVILNEINMGTPHGRCLTLDKGREMMNEYVIYGETEGETIEYNRY